MAFDLAIIGGGPAGMMSAISAGHFSKKVCLLEKNNVLGKKLLLTGKGRCNLTNNRSIPEIIEAFGPKGKFLYSTFSSFSNKDLIDFFNKKGVKTKVERGNRVFPVSDRAEAILSCLERELRLKKIKIAFNFKVKKIKREKELFKIVSGKEQSLLTKKVLIATGGKSYPATGSTGDGYWLAKKLGHQILSLEPALASLIVEDKDIRSLTGLTLKNVNLSFTNEGKKKLEVFGEMLFTHTGISGPIVLSSSKQVYQLIKKGKKIKASIDLKPALNNKTLKNRIHREIHKMPKKEYQTLLKELLPQSLIPLFIKKTKIDKHKQSSLLNSKEIAKIIAYLKNFSFNIDRVASISSAIVTSGGIDINDINQRTMESKITPNLYFAGEIIALNGPTGGYNLQKAFSTGWVAGKNLKN